MNSKVQFIILVFTWTCYETVDCLDTMNYLHVLTDIFSNAVVYIWKILGVQPQKETEEVWITKMLRPQKYRVAFDDFVKYAKTVTKSISAKDNNYEFNDYKLDIKEHVGINRYVESHSVLTIDGYFLILHRLILENETKPLNQSVLLHHGLLGSSLDWFLRESNDSLPLQLSAAGYDVWMANARGNIYSRKHITLANNSPQFWKFSFQEMGSVDLPAIINYIWRCQHSDLPISFVGHSMGATALLVMLSKFPQYNALLKVGILLAPLAFMGNAKGPLRDLAQSARNPSSLLLDILGNGEVIPSRKIPDYVMSQYCHMPFDRFCQNPLFFACGNLTMGDVDDDFAARLMNHVPARGSTRTILHYVQLISSSTFHEFNDPTAEFALNNITLPIAIFSSAHDQVATVTDVERLYLNIANPIKHFIFRNEKVSHTEFVWGVNMLLFRNITQLLALD